MSKFTVAEAVGNLNVRGWDKATTALYDEIKALKARLAERDEIERLRGLLREAREYVEPLCIEDDATRGLAGRIDAALDGVDQPDTARAEFNARYANEPTVDGRVELLKAEMRRICAGASQQSGAQE